MIYRSRPYWSINCSGWMAGCGSGLWVHFSLWTMAHIWVSRPDQVKVEEKYYCPACRSIVWMKSLYVAYVYI